MQVHGFLAAALGASCLVSDVASAVCTAELPEPLTYAALQKSVEDHDIRSVDELLPCLPSGYRKHFTLVYGSRSPEKDSADPLHPRVILFGRDASFLMAFTGNPDKPFYDRLQLIEFRREESAFFFAELIFQKDGVTTHESPPECRSCHGADGHPIWDTYDLWPGAYGSSNDSVPRGTPERRNFEAFLAGNGRRGRYAALGWLKKSPVAPYHDDDTFDPDLFPNLRLNKLLSRYNAKRVFREVRERPLYEEKKVEIARGLLGCDGFPVSGPLEREIRGSLRDAFQTKMQRNKRFAPALAFNAAYYAPGSARVVQVARLLGADPADWALTLEKSSFDFQDGDATLDDFLLTEIVRDLARGQAALSGTIEVVDEGGPRQASGVDSKDALSGRSRYRDYDRLYSALGGALLRSKARAACRMLAPKEQPGPGTDDKGPIASAETAPELDDSDENPLQRHCSSCHSGKQPSSTRLPTGDPAEMSRVLASNKTLAQDILRRIASRGPDHMPPRQVLTRVERSELEEYVRQLEQPRAGD